jgi:hypothetical protein
MNVGRIGAISPDPLSLIREIRAGRSASAVAIGNVPALPRKTSPFEDLRNRLGRASDALVAAGSDIAANAQANPDEVLAGTSSAVRSLNDALAAFANPPSGSDGVQASLRDRIASVLTNADAGAGKAFSVGSAGRSFRVNVDPTTLSETISTAPSALGSLVGTTLPQALGSAEAGLAQAKSTAPRTADTLGFPAADTFRAKLDEQTFRSLLSAQSTPGTPPKTMVIATAANAGTNNVPAPTTTSASSNLAAASTTTLFRATAATVASTEQTTPVTMGGGATTLTSSLSTAAPALAMPSTMFGASPSPFARAESTSAFATSTAAQGFSSAMAQASISIAPQFPFPAVPGAMAPGDGANGLSTFSGLA